MPITVKDETNSTNLAERFQQVANEHDLGANQFELLSARYAKEMTTDLTRSNTVLMSAKCTDLLAKVFPLAEDESVDSLLRYLAGTVIAETIAVARPKELLSQLDEGYVDSPFANNAYADMPVVLANILMYSDIPSNNVTRYLFRRFEVFRPLLEDVRIGLAGFQFISERASINYISAWRIWHDALVANWMLTKAQSDADAAVQSVLADYVIQETADDEVSCLDAFYELDPEEQATLRNLSLIHDAFKEAQNAR